MNPADRIEDRHVGRHRMWVTIEIVVQRAIAGEHRGLCADHGFRLCELVLRPELNAQMAQHGDAGDHREYYKDAADLYLHARLFRRG